MAEEQVAESLEESAADFIFGEEAPEPEYTPEPEPVVEGDDEGEVEPQEEVEETGFVEVEYEGALYEVPENLKDALLRQSDYTTKTQEVAAQRKEVEVQLGAIKQAQEQFQFAEAIQGDVLKAQQLDATANQYHDYLRENIDSLTSTDIEKIRLTIEDSRRQRDELVQSVQGKQAEFQQAQEQSYMELLNKGTEVLRQKIPGWGEDQQKQVRDYALSNGFTEAEIGQVVDPRQVETLWKAAQFDALKSGVTPAVKKVQGAPTIKPKARDPMPDNVKQKLNLRKKLKSNKLTNSDKANLIGEDIASKFF